MKKVYSHTVITSPFGGNNSELHIDFYYDVDDRTKYDDNGKPIDGFGSYMSIELINTRDGTSSLMNFGPTSYEEFMTKLINSQKL